MMGAENQQAVIFEAESDALSHRLYLKPSQGGYKVSVIWLPERMNLTCANKMLKLLEEPPQKTVFLLVSEEPERLLETIRSRVQRFDVHRIADEAIEQALVARRGLDEDTAHRVARSAMGSWLRSRPRATQSFSSWFRGRTGLRIRAEGRMPLWYRASFRRA